jgi:hypothetical protein
MTDQHEITADRPENIFGKQRGRFDEVMAARSSRTLYDQMRGAFAAMTEDQKLEACKLFTEEFPHRFQQFRLISETPDDREDTRSCSADNSC